MSKFKGQTEDTPLLSSDESTEAKAQPSEQSANSEGSKTYTQTTKRLLLNTTQSEKSDLTTPTTVEITEKIRQHAMLAKVALRHLEKAGLVKRFKVLSKDREVLKMRIEFDNTLWSEDLELK